METNKDNQDKKHLQQQPTSGRSEETEETGGINENYSSDDKYLAMEQPGVQYTQDAPHVARTDSTTPGADDGTSGLWESDAPVSRNSDAFNQDDNVLADNIDLDEDQSQSISSDEDIDTNTLDETR